MRRLFSVLLLLTIACSVWAQNTHTTEIKLRRGEHWWGLFAGGDMRQPFSETFSMRTDSCGCGFFTTPMMVSGNGRYLWSAQPFRVDFGGDKLTVVSGTEEIKVEKGGRTLREAYLVCYHNNIKVTGSAPPGELFTRIVYDISLEEAVAPSAEKLLEYADEIVAAGLPTGIFLLPHGWESTSREMDFDRELYPDPAAAIGSLHARGFKVMVTLSPYIPAAGKRYADARAAGKLLAGKDGSPLIVEGRGGYAACLDFTSESVADDFTRSALALQERYGIDGFLLDCAGVIPPLTDDHARLVSFLGNWNSVGDNFDLKINSSAFYAPSPPSVSALGDPERPLSWENLDRAAGEIVNAGLSGYIYSYYRPGHIGRDTDEALILRAIQLSLFMPVAVMPPSAWKMDNPRYRDEVKKAALKRAAMAEYMSALAESSGNTAEPFPRHMEYQYPNQGFYNCGGQFMLGTRYLVVPVTSDSGKQTVRLPKGVWISPEGKTHRGPRVMEADVSAGGAFVYELQGK